MALTQQQYDQLLAKARRGESLTEQELDDVDLFDNLTQSDRSPRMTQDRYDQLLAKARRGESLTEQELDDVDLFDRQKQSFEQTTAQLPELAEVGISKFTEGLDPSVGSQVVTSLAGTTILDPQEMADVLKQQFGSNIGITYSPIPGTDELVINATNNVTGKTITLNRPGLSPQDVISTLGLITAFSPSGFAKSVASRLGLTAGTSTAIQSGQALSGGSFDPEDVVIETAFGGLGESAGIVAKSGIKELGALKQKSIDQFGKQIAKRQSLQQIGEIPKTLTQSIRDITQDPIRLNPLKAFMDKPSETVVKAVAGEMVLGAPGLPATIDFATNLLKKQRNKGKITLDQQNTFLKMIDDVDVTDSQLQNALSMVDDDVAKQILKQVKTARNKAFEQSSKALQQRYINDPLLQQTIQMQGKVDPIIEQQMQALGQSIDNIAPVELPQFLQWLKRNDKKAFDNVIKQNRQQIESVKQSQQFVEQGVPLLHRVVDDSTRILAPTLPVLGTIANGNHEE